MHDTGEVPAAGFAPRPDHSGGGVEVAFALRSERDRYVADHIQRRRRRGRRHGGQSLPRLLGGGRLRLATQFAAQPPGDHDDAEQDHQRQRDPRQPIIALMRSCRRWRADRFGRAGDLGGLAGRFGACAFAQGGDIGRVDPAGAGEAVLGLKPHHRGARAGAEATIDRSGPVATAYQAPLHLSHPSGTVRARIASAAPDAAGRPPARESRRGVDGARRQRIADLASVPPGRHRRVIGDRDRRLGHRQGQRYRERRQGPSPLHLISDQSSVYRPAETAGRGAENREAVVSPGARAGR